MRNPRVRPLGLWDKRPIERWECEEFDANQAAAINGDDGEAFDAETQIVIGGDGMQITAPFRAAQCTYAALIPAIQIVYATRSRTRFMPIGSATPETPAGVSVGDPLPVPETDWRLNRSEGSFDGVVGGLFWKARTIAADKFLWVPLRLPVGAELTEITMSIHGASGHSASAPATLPRIELHVQVPGVNTTTNAGGTTDTYSSAAAYQAAHSVTRSLSVTVLANRIYWARIRNENGANAVAGMRVASVRATCSITAQDEWIPG